MKSLLYALHYSNVNSMMQAEPLPEDRRTSQFAGNFRSRIAVSAGNGADSISTRTKRMEGEYNPARDEINDRKPPTSTRTCGRDSMGGMVRNAPVPSNSTDSVPASRAESINDSDLNGPRKSPSMLTKAASKTTDISAKSIASMPSFCSTASVRSRKSSKLKSKSGKLRTVDRSDASVTSVKSRITPPVIVNRSDESLVSRSGADESISHQPERTGLSQQRLDLSRDYRSQKSTQPSSQRSQHTGMLSRGHVGAIGDRSEPLSADQRSSMTNAHPADHMPSRGHLGASRRSSMYHYPISATGALAASCHTIGLRSASERSVITRDPIQKRVNDALAASCHTISRSALERSAHTIDHSVHTIGHTLGINESGMLGRRVQYLYDSSSHSFQPENISPSRNNDIMSSGDPLSSRERHLMQSSRRILVNRDHLETMQGQAPAQQHVVATRRSIPKEVTHSNFHRHEYASTDAPSQDSYLSDGDGTIIQGVNAKGEQSVRSTSTRSSQASKINTQKSSNASKVNYNADRTVGSKREGKYDSTPSKQSIAKVFVTMDSWLEHCREPTARINNLLESRQVDGKHTIKDDYAQYNRNIKMMIEAERRQAALEDELMRRGRCSNNAKPDFETACAFTKTSMLMKSMSEDFKRNSHRVGSEPTAQKRRNSQEKLNVSSVENHLHSHRSFPDGILRVVCLLSGNHMCCDCAEGFRDPSGLWASVTYGTLLCEQCAFNHINNCEKVRPDWYLQCSN